MLEILLSYYISQARLILEVRKPLRVMKKGCFSVQLLHILIKLFLQNIKEHYRHETA